MGGHAWQILAHACEMNFPRVESLTNKNRNSILNTVLGRWVCLLSVQDAEGTSDVGGVF